MSRAVSAWRKKLRDIRLRTIVAWLNEDSKLYDQLEALMK